MQDKYSDQELDESYRQMALDEEHEAEALEWIEAVIGDVSDYDEEDREEG